MGIGLPRYIIMEKLFYSGEFSEEARKVIADIITENNNMIERYLKANDPIKKLEKNLKNKGMRF